MHVIWAIVMGLFGVWLIVMPKSWMLLGSRWRFKNGANLEPSDAYVMYYRASGMFLTVVMAGIIIAMLVAQADRARRDLLEDLWNVDLRTSDHIQLATDPTVLALAAFPENSVNGEVWFDASRAAIVGRDDLGDIGDTAALQEGDLLVGLGYSTCTFSHLIVVEDAERVVVRIVYTVPQYDLPGVPVPGPPPDGSIWEGIEQYDDYLHCTRRFAVEDDDIGLLVFRVPLKQPLGDRVLG